MGEIVKKYNPAYSKDFSEFYRDVIWWGKYEPDRFNKNNFLVQLLARGAKETIEHAQNVFGFTDDDFREALRNAPAGVVMYEEKWKELNIKYGIDPPLLFPRPAWVLKAIAEAEEKEKRGA